MSRRRTTPHNGEEYADDYEPIPLSESAQMSAGALWPLSEETYPIEHNRISHHSSFDIEDPINVNSMAGMVSSTNNNYDKIERINHMPFQGNDYEIDIEILNAFLLSKDDDTRANTSSSRCIDLPASVAVGNRQISISLESGREQILKRDLERAAGLGRNVSLRSDSRHAQSSRVDALQALLVQVANLTEVLAQSASRLESNVATNDTSSDESVLSCNEGSRTISHTNMYVVVDKEKDVILGRGGRSNSNGGNQRFLKERDALQASYLAQSATPDDKKLVCAKLMDTVKSWGGRFLKCDSPSVKTISWYEVKDVVARKKCGQALREKVTTPEARKAKRESLAARKLKAKDLNNPNETYVKPGEDRTADNGSFL
jgi:hypothetical protein